VCRLYTVAQRLGVMLDAEWILTADNVWEDQLIRTKDSTVWSLEPRYYDSLDSLYGPHMQNCFPPLCATLPPTEPPASAQTKPAAFLPDCR